MQNTSTYKWFLQLEHHTELLLHLLNQYQGKLYLQMSLIVASNAHISTPLFRPLWIIESNLKIYVRQCQWSYPSKFWRNFLVAKYVSFYLLACGNEISNRKNWRFFFRNLNPHNSRFNRKRVVIPRKNVGLRLWFTLFGS